MPLIKFSYQNNFVEAQEDNPLTWEQSEQERLQSKLDTYERSTSIGRELQSDELREWRNEQLAMSDWRIVSDAPGDTDAWKTYRQKLRDLPLSGKFPTKFETADFPLAPGESSIPEDVEQFIITNNDPLGIGTTSWVGNITKTETLKVNVNEPAGIGTNVISVASTSNITTSHIYDDGETAISITAVGSDFVTIGSKSGLASTDYAAGSTSVGIDTEGVTTDNWIESGSGRIAITGIGTENTITLAVGLAQTISTNDTIRILKKDYSTISLASTVANATSGSFDLRRVTTELVDQGTPKLTVIPTLSKTQVNAGDYFDLTLTYTNALGAEEFDIFFEGSNSGDFNLINIINPNGKERGSRDVNDEWVVTNSPVGIITIGQAHKGVTGTSTLRIGITTNPPSGSWDMPQTINMNFPILGISTSIELTTVGISSIPT